MRSVLILSLIINLQFTFSQETATQKRLDSLQVLLETSKSDSLKTFLLVELASNNRGVDSTKQFDYAFQALALGQHIGDSLAIAYANYELGGAFLDYSVYDKAKMHLTNAQRIGAYCMSTDSSRESMYVWVNSTLNLGIIEGGVEGNVDEQIAKMQLVAPVIEKMKDTLSMGKVQLNLGIKFMNLEQFNKAHRYFTKSIEAFKQVKNDNFLASAYLTAATNLYYIDSISQMKTYLDKARIILDKDENNVEWSTYYENYGLYYSLLGQYDQALIFYRKAEDYLKKSKVSFYSESLLISFIETYEAMGKYDSSLVYLEKFLKSVKSHGHKVNEALAYREFARYNEELGNTQLAYNYYKKYVQLNDSINITDQNKTINELELKYESEKNKREILELTNQNNKTQLDLQKKKAFGYQMSAISTILAIVLLTLFYFYRAKQRKAIIREQAHQHELDRIKQEHRNKVFNAMLEGEEKERLRISKDLHDGLGGMLSGIHLKLAKVNMENQQENLKLRIDDVLSTLDGSLNELRMIARNLMPKTLKKYGIKAALKDYCQLMSNTATTVSLQYYGNINLDSAYQTTIYRIVQELINNAVKHSEANEVLVQLFTEPYHISITVEDNGKGFDTKSQGGGLGLSNLKNRVEYLGGILDIQSEENKGTTANIEIELNAYELNNR